MTGRERDVASAATALPNAEADELQAGEQRLADEMELDISEFSRGVAAIVRGDFDGDGRPDFEISNYSSSNISIAAL